MKQPSLSIVIPVYNEPENIKLTIQNVKKHIKTKHEIIVVFDSKKDMVIRIFSRQIQHLLKNILEESNSLMLFFNRCIS